MSDETRDRVRALVREVLANAMPNDASSQDQTRGGQPSRFVQVAPQSTEGQVVTRDESSKSVITEDDVRGLEAGSVLRIGEGARLTPLAADIVNDQTRPFTAQVRGHGATHLSQADEADQIHCDVGNGKNERRAASRDANDARLE